MFSNLLGPIPPRRGQDYQQGFVQEVNIQQQPGRDRKFERKLWIFWGVIIAKCVLVWWLMVYLRIPFSPWWVVAPTLMFAALVTAVYIWRD